MIVDEAETSYKSRANNLIIVLVELLLKFSSKMVSNYFLTYYQALHLKMIARLELSFKFTVKKL